MTRPLHPPCAGAAFYGPHSAKVPAAYTIISPGGIVWYACDTDCLARVIDQWRQNLNLEPARLRGVAR